MRFWVRNKKGSLSLSMEAIVILILAVVMLGLALTFVRGIFTKMGGNIDKTIDLSNLDKLPSEGEPVVISPSSPILKYKGQADVAAGFYNPSILKRYWVMELSDLKSVCNSGDLCGTDDKDTKRLDVQYSSKAFYLDKDKALAKPINFVAKDKDSVKSGDEYTTYIVSVKFCSVEKEDEEECPQTPKTGDESYTKDFIVTVRR